MPQVAIVTGGGNGIGRCVALRFARAEIAVGIADHDQEAAQRVADEIVAVGGRARAFPVDVAKAAEVEDVVGQVLAEFGTVDILANIAGGTIHMKPIEELSWAEWREVLDVNLKGTFLFCRQVAPVMMAARKGRIVNTASNYGFTGSALRTPYSSAKAGIIGFSKSLAQELAEYQVLVNVVAPGPTDTARVLARSTPEVRERWKSSIPFARTAQPEEVAEGFFFLAGPENAYITGYTLNVSGGLIMN